MTMADYATSRLTWIVLLALSVIGFLLILYSTPHGGLNIDVDSTEYYAQARSLRAGAGTLFFGGTYDANFPPGYPVFLLVAGEIGGAVGLMPVEAARWLQALIYGLTVLCAGLLFLGEMRSKTLALIGTAAVTGSLLLLQAAISAWSEPLFILLSLIIFLLLRRYLARPSWKLLIVAILLTAWACIQRYMGLTIVAAGGLAILLFAHASMGRRLRDALLYGVVSFAPLAARFAYNAGMLGLPAGIRPPAQISILDAATHASNVLTAWFVPYDVKAALLPIGLLVLLILCASVMIRALRRHDNRLPTLSATFVGVYCILLIAAHAVIDITTINNREMSPIFPYLIALLFALLDRASTWLAARMHQPRASLAVAALALIWLAVYPLAQTAQEVRALRSWCCELDGWQALDVVQWLDGHPLDGIVLTNSTLPLYTARFSDATMVSLNGGIDAFDSIARPGDWVVWFDDSLKKLCAPSGYYCHKTLYTLDALRPRLETVAEWSDGGIYRVIG